MGQALLDAILNGCIPNSRTFPEEKQFWVCKHCSSCQFSTRTSYCLPGIHALCCYLGKLIVYPINNFLTQIVIVIKVVCCVSEILPFAKLWILIFCVNQPSLASSHRSVGYSTPY